MTPHEQAAAIYDRLQTVPQSWFGAGATAVRTARIDLLVRELDDFVRRIAFLEHKEANLHNAITMFRDQADSARDRSQQLLESNNDYLEQARVARRALATAKLAFLREAQPALLAAADVWSRSARDNVEAVLGQLEEELQREDAGV